MARALGKSDAERPEDFLTALDALQKECSVEWAGALFLRHVAGGVSRPYAQRARDDGRLV